MERFNCRICQKPFSAIEAKIDPQNPICLDCTTNRKFTRKIKTGSWMLKHFTETEILELRKIYSLHRNKETRHLITPYQRKLFNKWKGLLPSAIKRAKTRKLPKKTKTCLICKNNFKTPRQKQFICGDETCRKIFSYLRAGATWIERAVFLKKHGFNKPPNRRQHTDQSKNLTIKLMKTLGL